MPLLYLDTPRSHNTLVTCQARSSHWYRVPVLNPDFGSEKNGFKRAKSPENLGR